MNEKEKIFYEKIIGLDGKKYLEIRILVNKEYWISEYVQTIEELKKLFKKYKAKNYNIYYATNLREVKERKEDSIKERTFFYIDVEHSGEKPPITEKEYQKKLNGTIEYIVNYLNNKYQIKPAVLYISGRGLHLGYKIKAIDAVKYKEKFKKWFKQAQEEIEKNKPYKEIKSFDSVFNVGRIGGSPGTYNTKYEETPYRKILKIKVVENDIQPILDEVEEVKYVPRKIKINKKKLFEHPVFKILKLGVPMNKGRYVNNILMFCASLVCRDAGLNESEVMEVNKKMVEWGYWEGIIIPSEEYTFSEATINNWCFRNMDWCLEKKFKLPYKFLEDVDFEERDDVVEFEDRELKDIWKLLDYVADFNTKYYKFDRGVRVLYGKSLFGLLKKNCVPLLREFLDFNDLWYRVVFYRKEAKQIYL